MSDKTMSALITDIERALYQSAGPTVQLYSQDIIMQMVQDAFDHLFTAHWWMRFRVRETRTLDGTTGTITAPLTNIKQYDDILHVYNAYDKRPIPILAGGSNTHDSLYTTGSVARYIDADANSLFVVYPLSAAGTILVVGRKRPNVFSITDDVPFDHVAIKHFACWSYYVDDDSNPSAAAKHQGLFETRKQQLMLDDRNHRTVLDPQAERYPSTWYEGPY